MAVNSELKFGFINLALDFLEKEDLETATKYANEAKGYLQEELGISIVESASSVDSRAKSRVAWQKFKKENVDAVVIFNGTFSTGEVATEVIRNLDVPYLIWGIEEFAIKKHNFTGSMVGVLPLGTVFKNFGRPFSFAYGNVGSGKPKKNVNKFVKAVEAISYLNEATIGVIGMRPDGFEISDFDELAIKNKFGTTITKVSMYGFSKVIESVTEKEIDKDMEQQKKIFNIADKDLEEARGISKVYLATKKAIEENNLNAYAPDCWPELRDIDCTPICPANGRCNAEGVMASCECDVDGALTLMLQQVLAGSTPWFADFVNIIEENDTLLFWHCGNAPHNLSTDKPKIEKIFGGLSQVAALKSGVVTVCRLNSIRGEYVLHVGIGEAVETEPLLKGSNLSIRMEGGNLEFVESLLDNGIPHHNGLVYGDILEELEEFAKLMQIPFIISK
ncbi:MAG: L-fucose/L-arabinose isomerase family protein [Actinomycetota bacterium]